MIVILMGAPGAGKGTQADYLKSQKGFVKISTGDLLRREIRLKSDLGKQVEAIVNRGEFPSDQLMMQIMKNALDASSMNDVVLDGFPRTVRQAEWLEANAEIAGVVHIDAERDELIGRIDGRLVCTECEAVYHAIRKAPEKVGVCDRCGSALRIREDDTREKVLHRLDVYMRQTEPVLEFYKERNQYFRVNGNGDEAAVSEQLDTLLSKFGR